MERGMGRGRRREGRLMGNINFIYTPSYSDNFLAIHLNLIRNFILPLKFPLIPLVSLRGGEGEREREGERV